MAHPTPFRGKVPGTLAPSLAGTLARTLASAPSRALPVRRYRRLAGILACILAGSLAAQAPAGVRTFRAGALEITALLDAEIQLPATLLKDIDPAVATRLMGGAPAATDPVNAFLVHAGNHYVLVDTGGSARMHPALGHLGERLKLAGVKPEAIDAVLITHFHGDHLGGLLAADGTRAFPRAVLRVAQAENDYWMDPRTAAALPEPRKAMIAQIKTLLAPYQAAGAYKPFAPGEAPFEGVKALPTPGHTPGHTVYAFAGTTPFWAVGDIVHFGAVQFQHPEATVAFDSDSAKAAQARLEIWREAAREGALLGAAHLAFPGLGHVKQLDQAFAWVPLP